MIKIYIRTSIIANIKDSYIQSKNANFVVQIFIIATANIARMDASLLKYLYGDIHVLAHYQTMIVKCCHDSKINGYMIFNTLTNMI